MSIEPATIDGARPGCYLCVRKIKGRPRCPERRALVRPSPLVATHRHPRDDRRLLHPHHRHRPDLQQRATHPRPGCRRIGARGLYRRRYPQGPGGLPQVRPHGARHALGPRGLSRTRLHARSTCTAWPRSAGTRIATARYGKPFASARRRAGARYRERGASATRRRTATTPATEHARASRRARSPAFATQQREWGDYFARRRTPRPGCPPSYIRNPASSRR